MHNTQEWPDFYAPENSAELLRFFDRYLKDADNGWENTPRVRISVLDPGHLDEVGRSADTFPPGGYQHQTLYLHADGALKAQRAEKATINYSADGGSVYFLMPFDGEAELIGYSKLRLWVEAEGSNDMDIAVTLEKVDAEGKQIIRSTFPGFAAPTQATGVIRASSRGLDPERSTSERPHLALTASQPLSPGEVVPLDIAIWPMGLKFHKGEQLKLTVSAYAPESIDLGFGAAIIEVPIEGFTFDPAHRPAMQALGGAASTSPAWAVEQTIHAVSPNRGVHRMHLGGKWDSHLYVPLKKR